MRYHSPERVLVLPPGQTPNSVPRVCVAEGVCVELVDKGRQASVCVFVCRFVCGVCMCLACEFSRVGQRKVFQISEYAELEYAEAAEKCRIVEEVKRS
jgi:hypothetical protein